MTLEDVRWHHREGGKRVRAEVTCPDGSSYQFYLKESCKEVREILFDHITKNANGDYCSKKYIVKIKII